MLTPGLTICRLTSRLRRHRHSTILSHYPALSRETVDAATSQREPIQVAYAFYSDWRYPLSHTIHTDRISDQKVVVGIGNIYASEILHRAGIAPGARSSRLSLAKLEKITQASRLVLQEALRAGGTTLNDFRQAGGSEGFFQRELRVYEREGRPCLNCAKPIRKLVHAGRSTFWCPSCQMH